MTFVRRMVNDYKPFVKHQKLAINKRNKFCYDSSYNLINTNNTNRLFSAYSNKRLKYICICSPTIFISTDISVLEKSNLNEIPYMREQPLDRLFRFRTSNGQLIMPYEAVLGKTYSLYGLTNYTLNLVWQFCEGYTVFVSVGPYDSVTNKNPTSISYPNSDPRHVEYSTKFVLNYGITYLYIYGSKEDDKISRTESYYARIAIQY